MEKLLTVLVAQYRPDPAALRRTLASLVMQDTREFAVALADDGSPQPYFAESRAWLASGGVTDVTAVAMAQNGGTVRNILNASQAVQTRWVLTLSPGDYLRRGDGFLVAGTAAGRRPAGGLRQAGLLYAWTGPCPGPRGNAL